MNADLEAYRQCVVDALNRMASAEAKLSREADARGDETEGLLHEHGEICLRQAAEAVRSLGRE